MTIASSGLFIIQVFTFGVANHGTRWNASTLFMAALYLIVSFVGDIKVFPCIRKHTQCEHVRVVREVDLLIRLRGAHRNVMAILDGYVIRPRLPASSATFLRVFVRGKLLHSTRMQVECSSFPRTKNASFAVRNALLEAGKSNRAFSRQTQTHKRIHRRGESVRGDGDAHRGGNGRRVTDACGVRPRRRACHARRGRRSGHESGRRRGGGRCGDERGGAEREHQALSAIQRRAPQRGGVEPHNCVDQQRGPPRRHHVADGHHRQQHHQHE